MFTTIDFNVGIYMPKTMNLNVRVSGTLGDFVSQTIGDEGDYDNGSEYVRDLIRRDKAQKEANAFESLKAELQKGFSAPDNQYIALDANDIISRNS